MPSTNVTPMHSETGVVTLAQILQRIPENSLVWHVLDFEGVGAAPDGMTQQAFTQAIRSSPDGYRMTWRELLAFAQGTEQVWDCLIVGCQPAITIRTGSVEKDGFPGCDYVIEAFDSTDWSVGVAANQATAHDAAAAAD